MIHNLVQLLWPLFVRVLEAGSVAYIVGKGLIATLGDVVDFLILVLS